MGMPTTVEAAMAVAAAAAAVNNGIGPDGRPNPQVRFYSRDSQGTPQSPANPTDCNVLGNRTNIAARMDPKVRILSFIILCVLRETWKLSFSTEIYNSYNRYIAIS